MVLELKGMRWTAPDGKEVLRSVDISLAEGESVWLSGPSGGGKSTVLRVINRLLEPSGGEAAFEGRPLAAWSVTILRRRAALLTQTPVMLPGLVGDNLAAPFRLKSAAGQAAPNPEEMREALARAGLTGVGLEAQAGPLSVGQKQRVALARLLLMKPKLLLLDEPIAALDPESAALVARAAAGFAAQGGAVLMVSHQGPGFPCRRLVLTDGVAREEAK